MKWARLGQTSRSKKTQSRVTQRDMATTMTICSTSSPVLNNEFIIMNYNGHIVNIS